MRVLRLASIHLLRAPPAEMPRAEYVARNGVTVSTDHIDGVESCLVDGRRPQAAPATRPTIVWSTEKARVRVGVSAVTDWDEPGVVSGGATVPRQALDVLEQAIGEFADLLAVTYQCRRVIRSPAPFVAIAASSADEGLFAQITHLTATRDQFSTARVVPPMLPADLTAGLADRMDGVALLADSLGEDTAIGRIRDLFRLFERAFRRGPGDCIDPLSTFLRSHPRHDALQFSKDEVRHWFEVLRATSMHADRRPTYARSVDVVPYLGRMEVAAYDVLFNKTDWRHPSAGRRRGLDIVAAVAPGGRNSVVIGPGAALQIQWMDPWGGYPIEHGSSVNLPGEWIHRLATPPDSEP